MVHPKAVCVVPRPPQTLIRVDQIQTVTSYQTKAQKFNRVGSLKPRPRVRCPSIREILTNLRYRKDLVLLPAARCSFISFPVDYLYKSA